MFALFRSRYNNNKNEIVFLAISDDYKWIKVKDDRKSISLHNLLGKFCKLQRYKVCTGISSRESEERGLRGFRPVCAGLQWPHSHNVRIIWNVGGNSITRRCDRCQRNQQSDLHCGNDTMLRWLWWWSVHFQHDYWFMKANLENWTYIDSRDPNNVKVLNEIHDEWINY